MSAASHDYETNASHNSQTNAAASNAAPDAE
jgi:hypothetical protein